MNLILAIPIPIRVAGLFVFGVCVGGLINLATYRLAWRPRSISPWSSPLPSAPPRRGDDRVPIFGWLGLRREAGLHGRGFWVRPMLVDLLVGVGFAALYWWEIERAGLTLPGVPAASPMVLHVQYVCHLILICLMLVGSLIDCDEKIIPDTITLPGTLVGLLAAAVYPWSLLPDMQRLPGAGDWPPVVPVPPEADFLHVTSPSVWPDCLTGSPVATSLAIALGCWWLWCVAILPRTWYSRHGWRRAFQLMLARLRKERSTRWILLLGLIGSGLIAVVWFAGEQHWRGLCSALVGMAAGGGLIWTVRVVGTAVLRREAMGFGDVTLMAMIGAFLGWQACLIIFFLAPFAGLVIGLISVVLRRGSEIPYGPFLCLAALIVIVRWSSLWGWAMPIFGLGLMVPVILAACMVLMAVLLGLMQLVRRAFRCWFSGDGLGN